MLSESARMTTAEEAKFRINAPNSKPRAIKVIALDQRSQAIVKKLAEGDLEQGVLFCLGAFRQSAASRRRLVDEDLAERHRRPHHQADG